MNLSIVIPVYRSAEILPALVDALEMEIQAQGWDAEVILVNDGSPDNSWAVIQELAKCKAFVCGINLLRNFGQHNALLCGIRAARHEIVVTMDDDLQHPPSEIKKLLQKLEEGYDVVYGYPEKEQHGFLRDIASVLTKMTLQRAMGAGTARHISAFRAFRRDLRRAFDRYEGAFVSIDVLLTWGTTSFAAVATDHRPRLIGKSNYTFGKLFVHAVNMFTGFSVIPLQISSFLGFSAFMFGMVILAYVVSRAIIFGSAVPGFPFLASLISIFSGTQLLVLGIFGEYLARMHFQILRKPAYVEKEHTVRASVSTQQDVS